MADQPMYSFATLRNRLVVQGELVAVTGLRIGAGRASDVLGSDLPVLRDALSRPYIPGASLKGALRARMEGLVRAAASAIGRAGFEPLQRLALELRRSPAAQHSKLIQTIERDRAVLDFGELEQRTRELRSVREQVPVLSEEDYSSLIWRLSTTIDLTFGSPEVAGRLFLKDAQVDPSLWFGQFEERNGVALNRDTETVETGLLYDYEVVPAGTRFDFELVLENAEEWQLGMVLLSLKPWERGEAQIGGFRSRGLGYVRLERVERRFLALHGVDDVLQLLDEGVTAALDDAQAESWYQAFRLKLGEEAKRAAAAGS